MTLAVHDNLNGPVIKGSIREAILNLPVGTRVVYDNGGTRIGYTVESRARLRSNGGDFIITPARNNLYSYPAEHFTINGERIGGGPTKDHRPQPGQRVKITIFGTRTNWDPRPGSTYPPGTFEVKTDKGRFHMFSDSDQATIEIQHEPLPGVGVVIRHINTGVKRIHMGDGWYVVGGNTKNEHPVRSDNWSLLEQWQNGEWDIFSDLNKD